VLRGFAIAPMTCGAARKRIAARFDRMLQSGLVDEVAACERRTH
jgi:tRNA A37 N6-isopentenylltransferase MiaA